MPITERQPFRLFAAVTVPRAAETGGRFAVAVLNAQRQLRVKRRRREPGNTRPRIAQAVRAQETRVHQRLIHKGPRMRMLRVQATEVAEDLPRANLKLPGQRNGFQPRLFQFHKRFALGINREQ
jgi:hypothetical protein